MQVVRRADAHRVDLVEEVADVRDGPDAEVGLGPLTVTRRDVGDGHQFGLSHVAQRAGVQLPLDPDPDDTDP